MEEEINLQDQALPVADLDEDFDLDIPPTTAQDYLRRVYLEAKDCPAVVVASIDPSLVKKKQTFQVSNSTGCSPCPLGFALSQSWQRQQVADFSEVLAKCKSTEEKSRKSSPPPLLDLDDVEGWCKLCFGRMVVDKHKDILPDGSDGESIERPPKFNYEDGTPPLLSIISKMDQPAVLQVLEYHVDWFEATGFTTEQGRWFYALLASVSKPLSPETCSLLRRLSRNCWNLRAVLIKDDPHLIPLNLLIALVGRYFDQTDMADQG
ncbi:gem-associated protein 2-like isoform X2 [Lineus longissimus]|uniref:gem-associated protein 2-like isoform X2 n=1 Tax=Lineus longissimus TaxID=88925 RepID=UPI00315C5744